MPIHILTLILVVSPCAAFVSPLEQRVASRRWLSRTRCDGQQSQSSRRRPSSSRSMQRRHPPPLPTTNGTLTRRRGFFEQASDAVMNVASASLTVPIVAGAYGEARTTTTTTATTTATTRHSESLTILPGTSARSTSSAPSSSSDSSSAAKIQQLYRVIPDASPSLTPKLAATSEADFFRRIGAMAAPGGALWLGEHHSSSNDHALQEAVIRRIALNRRGYKGSSAMAIGLEQVQVRYQPALDAYIRGDTSIDEMRRSVEWDRRWVWPFDGYRPVFETARELGIPLVALNVDSEDMSAVEKRGYAGLSRRALDRYIPDPTGFARFASVRSFRTYVDYVIEPSYDLHQALGLLQRTMTGEALDHEMSYREFLSGRMLWDEAMAARAYEWIQANPNGLLVGLVGADHVKFRSGIPGRFSRLAARDGTGASGSGPQSVSVLLNPTLIDTRPPGSVGGELAAGSDSPLFPDRLTLQLRYLKDGVDRGSADVYLPASTGGVLPLADYIMIGGQ